MYHLNLGTTKSLLVMYQASETGSVLLGRVEETKQLSVSQAAQLV